MGFKLFLLHEDFKTAEAKWVKAGNHIEDVRDAIGMFKSLKDSGYIVQPDNDIDKWATKPFTEFADFTEEKRKEAEKKKNVKSMMKYNKEKVKKIFENQYALVLVPLTPQASEGLAHINGTNHWCIASTGAEKWWRDYIGKQGLTPYYVFFKEAADMNKWDGGSGDLSKVAVMISTNEGIDSIWNRPDHDIKGHKFKGVGIVQILEDYGIPVHKFDSLAEETGVGSEDIDIDSVIEAFEFYWEDSGYDLNEVLRSRQVKAYVTKLENLYEDDDIPEDKQLNMDEVFENIKDANNTTDWGGWEELIPQRQEFVKGEEDILDDMFGEIERQMERARQYAYDSALDSEIEYQRENAEEHPTYTLKGGNNE